MYKCMICGKEHKSLDDYAACVAVCNKRVKEEQIRAREERLNAEKSKRIESIKGKHNDLRNEVCEFVKDYGYSPIIFPASIAELFNSVFF